MPLPILPPPALVQADPEAVLISLFPLVERQAWRELMERSQVLLQGESIAEGTRAKLRWMMLRGLAGMMSQGAVRQARAEAILAQVEGRLVAFPARPLDGREDGWKLSAEARTATGLEKAGPLAHAEVHLSLLPGLPQPTGEAVAEGVLEAYQARTGLFAPHPRLTLRFREARFRRP